MSSEKRILANRANGAKSRGPKTPHGQARSRFAVRTRRLAEANVLSMESAATFGELFNLHAECFAPCNHVEIGLVEELTSAYWRIRRGWAIENHLLDKTISGQNEGDHLTRLSDAYMSLLDDQKLSRLRREEARLHLMYQRSLLNLVLLRNSKFRVEPNNSLVCNLSSQNQEPTEPNEPTEPKPFSDPGALAA